MRQRLRALALPLIASAAVTILAVGIVSARSGGGESPISAVVSAPHALAGDLTEYLSGLAKNLGITDAELSDALKKTSNDRIDKLLADGTITQDEATRLKDAVANGNYFAGEIRGDGPHGFKGFMGGGVLKDALTAVADDVSSYLGLTANELKTKLAAGDSLGKIAGDQGKTVDGLKTTITDSAKTQLDKAVASGDLTQAQADELTSQLSTRLDDIVNGNGFGLGGLRDGDFGGHGFRFKREFRFGFPGPDQAPEAQPTATPTGQT